MKNNGTFPPNLELIDAQFDEDFSTGVCAFLDTDTGEITQFESNRDELS
ncbi:hypothetical protein [uncultured Clostridium sp.]|nr:hypothetical protein [uncultured Clostridium sp.]